MREINDAQLELGIFRGCLGFGKVNHLMRARPPDLVGGLADFDVRLGSILSNIVSCPSALNQDALAQSALPVGMGGLGVTQTVPIAAAAYISSRVQTHGMMTKLLEMDPGLFIPTDVQKLMTAHNVSTGTNRDFASLGASPKPQHVLTNDIHRSHLAGLMDRASLRRAALLRGISMPKANEWVKCAPIAGLGQRVPSDEFRTMLRRHLDLDLLPNPAKCKFCGRTMDVKGDHAFAHDCKTGTHKTDRHNHVRDICLGLAKDAAVSGARLEAQHLLPNSGRKPGDIVADHYHAGFMTTAFDVTISYTLQPSSLSNAAKTTGHVAEAAHIRKLSKSLEQCKAQNIKFVPPAWESTGGATDMVHSLIERWSNAAADRSGIERQIVRNGVYAKLSVAIQRSNARAILDRITEHSSRFTQ